MLGRHRNFTGLHFWAWGYCVSLVGLEEKVIREYVRHQEREENGRSNAFFQNCFKQLACLAFKPPPVEVVANLFRTP